MKKLLSNLYALKGYRVAGALLCLFAAGLSAGFLGCSKKSGEEQEEEAQSASEGGPQKVSIMFQGSDNEQAAMKKVTEAFTNETGIGVELLYTPHDSYTEKLASYISNKKMPDIISIDGPNLPTYVWGGHITCIEPYIDKAIIDDMTASNVAQCSYPLDNKLYAIAQTDSTVCLFCNKEYLEKVGARIPASVDDSWTIDEFDELLGKLASLDEVRWPLDIAWAINIAGSEWGTYAFYTTLVSGGADIIDRKTWKSEGTLNSPEAVKVLSYFQKWNKNGWIVPKGAGDNTLFSDKRESAILWGGNWNSAPLFETLGDNGIVLPLPNFGHGTKSPNATWIWAISTESKNKEAAGKLLSYMMTQEQYIDDLVKIGLYPALGKVKERAPDYSDPKRMKLAYEQSACAVARPPHPAYPVITLEFANGFEDILNGADIKATLDKEAKAIDEDIADNDGYPPFGGE